MADVWASLKRLIRKSKAHRPLVIAKIEDQQAVVNLDAILSEADGVMVARGDLGIEVPHEELPIIQRRVVKRCLRIGKSVIVATHMLESMIGSPMPTRAEVTDVANAVFEQADAIMLTGETTVEKYPVKCVEVMDRIARRIEQSGGANYPEQAELEDPRVNYGPERGGARERNCTRRRSSSSHAAAAWPVTSSMDAAAIFDDLRCRRPEP